MIKRNVLFVLAVFAVSLVALSGLRGLFLASYAPEEGLVFSDVLLGLMRGVRFDAKWSAIVLLPSLATLLAGLVFPLGKRAILYRISEILAIVGAASLFLLGLVNYGFFGFYGSPINSLVFGLLQDDTWAIIVSIVKDWPVIRYSLALIIFIAILFGVKRKILNRATSQESERKRTGLVWILLCTLLFGVTARGSFGTFPLRQMDLNATTNFFINQAVNNGAQALYDANKERRQQDIGKNPLRGLQALGFKTKEEAEKLFTPKLVTATAEKRLPHIVLVVMEAMGCDLFEAYVPGINDTLGAFAKVKDRGDLFLNSLSIQNGTFPSLEGILFNTPISPISQSRYGYKPFPFSLIREFRDAGYKTIYLSSGTSVWRNVDANFPKQGFDAVLGLEHIKARYGDDIETGTWGVPDAYMFEMAKEELLKAEKEGKPLFLVCLSTTNHPPYKTPSGYKVNPVSYEALPTWKTKDKEIAVSILETYQYATDALGRFIEETPKRLEKKTIFVATGDHNTRTIFEYPDSTRLDHQFGVPLFFLVPDAWRPGAPDTKRWTGHCDIFPTLRELVLKRPSRAFEGQNVYGKESGIALTFSQAAGGGGLAISKDGAVANLASPHYFVRDTATGLFKATNSPTEDLKKLRAKAASRMGLADARVREGCLAK